MRNAELVFELPDKSKGGGGTYEGSLLSWK